MGPDAHALALFNRLLPSRVLHHITRIAMGIPPTGALRSSSHVDQRKNP